MFVRKYVFKKLQNEGILFAIFFDVCFKITWMCIQSIRYIIHKILLIYFSLCEIQHCNCMFVEKMNIIVVKTVSSLKFPIRSFLTTAC